MLPVGIVHQDHGMAATSDNLEEEYDKDGGN